jgi:hypothetical protein
MRKSVVQVRAAETAYIYNQKSRGFSFVKNEGKRMGSTELGGLL